MALIDAKAIQFASGLIESYVNLIEDNGTKALRILADFATTERVVSIVGIHNRTHLKHFTGDDLTRIERVVVESGNALSKTLAGRVDMADKLLDKGMLHNREEYFTLLNSGQLEPLFESEMAQLSVVREENEQILNGGSHQGLAIDNHVLHIKEHAAQLNSTEIRQDQVVAGNFLAAVMQHLEMLMDPMVQMLQISLGYETSIPAIGPMQGGAPGGAGGPQVPPEGEQSAAMGPDATAKAQPFLPSGEAA